MPVWNTWGPYKISPQIPAQGELLLVTWWKNRMWIFICPHMLIYSISCELCLIRKCHKGKEVKICTTLVRTIGRTLLIQGNLVVTRSLHAADGRDTAVLTTFSRQLNERSTLTCIDTFCVLIPGVSFSAFRISFPISGVVNLGCLQLATQSAKFECSQRRHWTLTNVLLSRHFHSGYLSWYK
jgi:hypothetical protein